MNHKARSHHWRNNSPRICKQLTSVSFYCLTVIIFIMTYLYILVKILHCTYKLNVDLRTGRKLGENMIFTGVGKLYINMKEWATKMEMKKRAKYIEQ